MRCTVWGHFWRYDPAVLPWLDPVMQGVRLRAQEVRERLGGNAGCFYGLRP
jgi:hypothetical protein